MSDQDLTHLALSESGFLFDSRSGHTFTLNSTGTFVLRRLLEGETREDALEALQARFQVTPERAAQDLDLFLSRLVALGLRGSA